VNSSEYIDAQNHYTLRSLVLLTIMIPAAIYPMLLRVRYFAMVVEHLLGVHPSIYNGLYTRGGTVAVTMSGPHEGFRK
jgi:hypothetical protein